MSAPPRPHGLPTLRPASFNDVYARELRALRPKVFGNPQATPPAADAADGPDARTTELTALFARVGTDLKGSATQWDADKAPLAALCLSGGGIRSATFNLGMVQGLARARLLQQFDYLSSVSGGGFVAGWLKAWMFRDGTDQVIEQLRSTSTPAATSSHASPPGAPRPASGVDPLHPEPKPLDQLRHYSNYLTPRVGLFSPDSWTVAALVVRNLILNWLVIVPILAAVVGLPQIGRVVMREIRDRPPSWLHEAGTVLGVLSVVFGLIASFNVHRFRRSSLEGSASASTSARATPGVAERTVALWAVLPLCMSVVLLAGAALARPWEIWCCVPQSAFAPTLLFAAVWAIGVPLAGWVFHRPSHHAWREFGALVVCMSHSTSCSRSRCCSLITCSPARCSLASPAIAARRTRRKSL
jgi:hypothetical protein